MAVGKRESAIDSRESVARVIRLTAANTTVTFEVRWLGMLHVRGRFREMEGMLRVPDGCIDGAEVTLDVAAASLRTGIDLRDRHLRGHRFLDADRHPLITFRSTHVSRPNDTVMVTGILTLRGVAREMSVRCPLRYADGQGLQSMVELSASFMVPRLSYGVGVARGLRRLNPLLRAIGDRVSVRAEVVVPATQLLPALLPALGQ